MEFRRYLDKVVRYCEARLSALDRSLLSQTRRFSRENRATDIEATTGMTRARFAEIFGDTFGPKEVAEFCVLAGNSPPRNPKEWSALAAQTLRTRQQLFPNKAELN